MPLWDYGVVAEYKPDVRAAALREEARARDANGFVRQTDWWAINEARGADGFVAVPVEDFRGFLISSTPEIRHVAVLLSPEAHLDPHDLKPIFEAAPTDGTTFLAHYVQGMAAILETHYASGSPFAHLPFIRDGEPQWDASAFGARDLEQAARLVGSAEKRFSFDCGRKQLLYRALEQDLDEADAKPDWFVPSGELLPFEGADPDCDLTFWDTEMFREPSGFQRPRTADISNPPEAPRKGLLSRLLG